MVRHTHSSMRVLLLGALLMLLLFAAGCGDDDSDDIQISDNPSSGDRDIDLDQVDSIAELVELIVSADHDQLRGHIFELDVWISPAPKTSGMPSTPSQGCPVVPEKQDWLSDEPIQTQIEIAGTALPNQRLAERVPVLRLVVPYTLGFVEIPERATIRGTVLDDQHADCAGMESLFILEEVVESLPTDAQQDETEPVQEWEQIAHESSGVVLEYPAGWEVEERDSSPSDRIRFLGPEGFRTIRFEIHEGETYWHPDANDGSAPPDVLGGERDEPVMAGQAHARLIDDSRRTGSEEREARIVFNHRGNTISLAMVFRDGAELDAESIWVFSEMASRMHLRGDVTMSDPMDPILAANEEIGEGPFLSEADARYVAVNASGMTAAEAIDAELVSERDARQAVDGACHNFDGRPSGVWLVTVDGVTQSGREAYRLVYLDAENGNRLCQAEAPGVS